MFGFAGHAVADNGDDEVVLRVGKTGGGLDATVSKGFRRGVQTITIGYGAWSVMVGIDDESEAPVDDMSKGFVIHVLAVASGKGSNGFFLEKRGMGLE